MFWILVGIAIITAIYYYLIKRFNYWNEQGVKQASLVNILRENWSIIAKKRTFAELICDIYNTHPNTRYLGNYQFSIPILVIKDPELIKQITVKDFEHFLDHRQILSADTDPFWAGNLFSLKGQRWKDMRSTLSPVFTSSKMKHMFVLMSECAEQFAKHFLNKNEDVVIVELKDIFTRFTNDVIATTAFGIKCDSLADPNNEFYNMGKNITNFGSWKFLKFFVFVLFPRVASYFKIGFFSKSEQFFFLNLVRNTIKVREQQGIIRPDMINLFMEARKAGLKYEENNDDMVVCESLRKWPSMVAGDRVCTKPYTIQPTSSDEKPVYLKEGEILMIPSFGVHRDPQYFPNPEKFDPERFSDENKDKIIPYSYNAFGSGPRNCIGSRFALLETKLIMFNLLSKFDIIPVEKTQVPLKLNRKTFNLTAKNGFWFGLKRR